MMYAPIFLCSRRLPWTPRPSERSSNRTVSKRAVKHLRNRELLLDHTQGMFICKKAHFYTAAIESSHWGKELWILPCRDTADENLIEDVHTDKTVGSQQKKKGEKSCCNKWRLTCPTSHNLAHYTPSPATTTNVYLFTFCGEEHTSHISSCSRHNLLYPAGPPLNKLYSRPGSKYWVQKRHLPAFQQEYSKLWKNVNAQPARSRKGFQTVFLWCFEGESRSHINT